MNKCPGNHSTKLHTKTKANKHQGVCLNVSLVVVVGKAQQNVMLSMASCYVHKRNKTLTDLLSNKG